jgi:hypothetical protein
MARASELRKDNGQRYGNHPSEIPPKLKSDAIAAEVDPERKVKLMMAILGTGLPRSSGRRLKET